MKKIFVLSLIASAFLFGCSDDTTTTTPKTTGGGDGGGGTTGLTVDNTQRSILWYWTATWCGPCGSTGSPLFKQIMDENKGVDIVAIDLHSSNSSRLVPGYIDPVDNTAKVSPAASQIALSIRPNGYIPLFTLNNEFQGNSSVNVATVNSNIDAHNAKDATVGVAASASADGNTITVKTKTKFFEETSGDYHISVLLLEKDVIAPQQVGGTLVNNFAHKQVVRASVVGGSLETQQGISNDAIASGSISADTEVEGEYTLEWEKVNMPTGFASWDFDKANTSVVVVIWKKNGNIFDTVNTIELDL
jgi:thiol-disulfide isomerase/thioredoxin